MWSRPGLSSALSEVPGGLSGTVTVRLFPIYRLKKGKKSDGKSNGCHPEILTDGDSRPAWGLLGAEVRPSQTRRSLGAGKWGILSMAPWARPLLRLRGALPSPPWGPGLHQAEGTAWGTLISLPGLALLFSPAFPSPSSLLLQ